MDKFERDLEFRRGDQLYVRGQKWEAINAFTEATAIDPSFFEGYLYKTIILLELNKVDSALDVINKALTIDPCSLKAHYYKGKALIRLRKWDDAIDSFSFVINSNANDAKSHGYLGLCFENTSRYEEAIQEYSTAIQIDKSLYNKIKICMDRSIMRKHSDYDRTIQNEKIIILKETVKVPCPYCGTLVENTKSKCNNCGGTVR
jgi:tetratricopeptide (TPR) repeat protein